MKCSIDAVRFSRIPLEIPPRTAKAPGSLPGVFRSFDAIRGIAMLVDALVKLWALFAIAVIIFRYAAA